MRAALANKWNVRWCLLGVAAVVIAVGGTAGAQGQGRLAYTPPLDQPAVPDPPEQRKDWTAPRTKLPPSLLRATALLFEYGMADPRGCEYREIEVGDTVLSSTHGFVLPSAPDAKARFAIGWDGVVYPAFRVGEPADLGADITGLVEDMKTQRRASVRNGTIPGPHDAGFAEPDRLSFVPTRRQPRSPSSVEAPSPLKLCLLLRIGRADLAEALFAVGTTWQPGAAGDFGVTFGTLAREWTHRVYKRAADAHARADDIVALDAVRRVAAFTEKAVPILDRADDVPPKRSRAGQPPPHFPDLTQLRELLGDQERRARERAREPVPGPEASAETRIAALIRDLDQARGGIVMDGMASPSGSKAERALVQEGGAAVQPLLAVLRSDGRLTRTVSNPGSRGARDDCMIHYVFEAARYALFGIMNTSEIPGGRDPLFGNDLAARGRAADAIETFWKKYGATPELGRHLQILEDDHATRAQWLDAAEALAQPNDVRGRGGSYTIPHRGEGKVPPPRGEPLRDRKNPSVTELMARRVESIDPSTSRKVPSNGSGEIFKTRDANRLAVFLAEWDPTGAIPTLRGRVARGVALDQAFQGKPFPDTHSDMGLAIARMTLLRIKASDPGALYDYAGWIRAIKPASYRTMLESAMFEPMWRYPDNPAVAEAARALFEQPDSLWVPLFRPHESGWGNDLQRCGLITSPLLGVEPFRALVLAGLADRRETGSVTTDSAGKIAQRLDDQNIRFADPPKNDPFRPTSSSTMPLRLADLYAWTLQALDGTPRFELYWPEAKRDETIAACATFLRRYGAGYRFRDATLYESQPFYPQHAKAVLALDKLDRPATPDDVRTGRAVFSIDAPDVRVWPMPAHPLKARWTTLEIGDDDPGLRGVDRSQGRPLGQIAMLQQGTVWQAEEVREGDRWRRFYGFVGRDIIARVPAEEIEFSAQPAALWAHVTAALDGRLVAPGAPDDGARTVSGDPPASGPLWLELWFRNHRGIASDMSTQWARTESGLSLRDGLSIRLFHSPEQSFITQLRVAGQPVGKEITPRPVDRHHGESPSRTLAPTETARAFRIDLRALFALERPGWYRVELSAPDFAPVGSSALPLVTYFQLPSPPPGR